MLDKLKYTFEEKLADFAKKIDEHYSLGELSPLLSEYIQEYIQRPGKRLRPILFLIGYLGFSKKPAKNVYSTAIAIELLHTFLLIHDDIIDKSDTRRGKPSLHAHLNTYLSKYKNKKFNGQDLSIVIGDMIYAIAIDAFVQIKEDPKHTIQALQQFTKTALNTGFGESIELLYGLKEIDEISKKEIYTIYDYKTAFYSFASPLSTGALLAGASQTQCNTLFEIGKLLGRAFQIQDDIIGIFGDEKKIGKSTLTDLQEAKKTILIWYAYHHATKPEQSYIKKLFNRSKVTKNDLNKIQNIITTSKALTYAQKQIITAIAHASTLLKKSKLNPKYKLLLEYYSNKLLQT